ncbi:FGGY-family carbohydrate kinase [Pseudonocardia nigra]|uniref:FGGY-family carbohydrate kinase n=1 Tax=Pseudonocardia nigra TaxID=1921578 RepID=UPI002484D62D|nr:FGGY-family carbohydrate kinase [Pseudonocardia nigra]
MAGIGAFEEPSAFVLTGTSQIAGLTGAEPAAPAPLLTVPSTCAPLPVCYGPTQAGGAALAWAATLLGRETDDVVALAMTADPAAVPRFLPYLDGERAPLWRPDVRGVLHTGPAGTPVASAAVVRTWRVLSATPRITALAISAGPAALPRSWSPVTADAARTVAPSAAVSGSRCATSGRPSVSSCTRVHSGCAALRPPRCSSTRSPDAGETATGDELYRHYLRDVDADLAQRGARA